MAYASMLLRDLQRFEDATARMDAQCPLGSGALAGTTYPLDRQFTAEKLGFAAPCANSLDGVSDRDFCIELANAISICMMHLSRLSEEIILWCSWEFKFIELDDAFTTGSSIMPQKKNPDVTELIRGKTGRVYGDLNTLLVMMKGIPLAYNKDMQEDKGSHLRCGGYAGAVSQDCHPHAGYHEDPACQHAPRCRQGLYQRHRLRRLPDQEGDALPGCLQADRLHGL